MNCSFLDMGGCFGPLTNWFNGVTSWWGFWGPWILWGLVALAALVILVLARKAAGTPGAIAAAGVIGAAIGAFFGRQSVQQDHEHLKASDPDAEPPVHKRRGKPAGGSLLGRSILPWNRK